MLTLAAGLLTAVIAVVLYLVTNTEKAGFRLLPTDAKGWMGFWLRSLILIVLVSIPLSFVRQMHPMVAGNLGSCSLVLLITSTLFYPRCRGLSVAGFLVAFVALLLSPLRSVFEKAS